MSLGLPRNRKKSITVRAAPVPSSEAVQEANVEAFGTFTQGLFLVAAAGLPTLALALLRES